MNDDIAAKIYTGIACGGVERIRSPNKTTFDKWTLSQLINKLARKCRQMVPGFPLSSVVGKDKNP